MSTTSTVITIIICALIVASIGYALIKGLWGAAKKITVPIQISLFVVMLVCIVRLFCTKENAQKLYDGIEQTRVGQNVENTMRAALNMKPVEASQADTKPTPVALSPVATVPPGVPESTPQPQAVPQPTTTIEPTPAPVYDYSHLNKGKKSFSYALPFNAKVTVDFKDNTYRVISESLGKLDADEKKEVGKLILTSLAKYSGKMIESWDKSKISIESRYDEDDGRTRVLAIIPPDAID